MHHSDRSEESISGLVRQLVDDGRAYVHAEIDVVRATATARVKSVRLAVILAVASLLFIQAGITVLFVGIGALLEGLIGQGWLGHWGGLVLSAILALAIAGGMLWYAVTHFSLSSTPASHPDRGARR